MKNKSICGKVIACVVAFASVADARPGIFGGTTYTSADDPQSAFTLGTLVGVGVPLYEPTVYGIRNDRVVSIRSADGEDYVLPGVYLLPSLTLLGNSGSSLSLIVPAGINSNRAVSVGFGVSYGFTVRKSVEFGIALSLIWNGVPRLNDAQEASLNSGAMVSGADLVIESSLRPSLALGIYLAPVF